jgi:hypothetical protein
MVIRSLVFCLDLAMPAKEKKWSVSIVSSLIISSGNTCFDHFRWHWVHCRRQDEVLALASIEWIAAATLSFEKQKRCIASSLHSLYLTNML